MRIRLSGHQRRLIAASYKWRCNGCHELLPPSFDIDHRIPLKSPYWSRRPLLDPNALSNLQPLCPNCHRLKSDLEATIRVKRSSMEVCFTCNTVWSIYFDHKCIL